MSVILVINILLIALAASSLAAVLIAHRLQGMTVLPPQVKQPKEVP